MSLMQKQINENTIAIQKINDDAQKPSGLPALVGNLNGDDLFVVEIDATGVVTKVKFSEFLLDLEGFEYRGAYNASTNSPDLDVSPTNILKGYLYEVSVAGTFFTRPLIAGDLLISKQVDPVAEDDWMIITSITDAERVMIARLIISTNDSGVGDKIATVGPIRGFEANNSYNGHTGMKAQNTNAGTSATASFIATISATDYLRGMAIQMMGDNYFRAALAGKGVTYSTDTLVIVTNSDEDIEFWTTPDFVTFTQRGKIGIDGIWFKTKETVDTSTIIDLGYTQGEGNLCNMASANATTIYTLTNARNDGKALVLINAASEPVITGATKVTGNTFTSGVDMYMKVWDDGNIVRFKFIQIIGVTAGGGDMILAGVQTVTGAKTFLNTKLLLRNVANSFNGSFINTNTADRIYTLQNSNGILAFTSDIPILPIPGIKSEYDTALSDGNFLFVGDAVTSVTGGTGITSSGGVVPSLSLDFSELTDMTADISGTTEFILQDNITESRKAASEIKLSAFNDDIKKSKSITIPDPVATDDATMFFTPVAITISDVRSHITGATNVVFNIGHASTRTGTQLDVFSSDITLTSTAGQSNNSGFNDNTIPANSWVWLDVVSVSGTPTWFHATIIYTED